jgi:hypothetical protein
LKSPIYRAMLFGGSLGCLVVDHGLRRRLGSVGEGSGVGSVVSSAGGDSGGEVSIPDSADAGRGTAGWRPPWQSDAGHRDSEPRAQRDERAEVGELG